MVIPPVGGVGPRPDLGPSVTTTEDRSMSARSLARRLFGRTAAPARHRPGPKPALSVHPLENREVPATFTISQGVLSIDMADVPGHRLTLDASPDGYVRVNGSVDGNRFRQPGLIGPKPLTRLKTDAVSFIAVFGSRYNDVIDLSGVTPAGFRRATGPQVDGEGGHDRIAGTAFADRLDGGAGDDEVRGGDGNDRIWGGAGEDVLYGDRGADRMDGGANEDDLLGGNGDDLLVGGAGKDHFNGGSGTDTAWVDAADVKLWVDVEVVKTGTPPKI